MSYREQALRASQRYAASFQDGALPIAPVKRLAVLACMDARLMPDRMLGLEIGDAHVVRNAGGLATDDALRSLVLSHNLQGVNEIYVINHSGCALAGLTEGEVRQRVSDQTGKDATGVTFHAFSDLEENVRAQVQKIASHPLISDQVAVYGFVYDVATGKLREVG